MKDTIYNFFVLLVIAILVPLIAGYALRKFSEYNTRNTIKREQENYGRKNYNKKNKPLTLPREELDFREHTEPIIFQLPKKENIMNFEKFKTVFFHPTFIKHFTYSIKKSINYKMEFYSEEFDKVSKLLIGTVESVGHDINRDRNTKYKNILKSIIESIIEKSKKLIEKSVLENFTNLMTDTEKGFKSVRGRTKVKDYLAKVLFGFARNPMLFNTTAQNILFMGSSGIGKTKLAQLIGRVLEKSGMFMRECFNVIPVELFTSEFVKSSGNLTLENLGGSLEGTCFIDEIHSLVGKDKSPFEKGGNSHGKESVNSIVGFLEPKDGKICVIGAGYQKDVEENFLGVNEGLDRRFPHVFIIDDYSPTELTDILLDFLYVSYNNFKLNKKESIFINKIISKLGKKIPNIFKKQAGDMKNLSSNILSSNGNFGKSFINKTPIIISGFNTYLEKRGKKPLNKKFLSTMYT